MNPDRVTYGGHAGTVELVVVGLTGDPETENDWQFETNGAGILIIEIEPKLFGRLYLPDPQNEEDLLFIARAKSACCPCCAVAEAKVG